MFPREQILLPPLYLKIEAYKLISKALNQEGQLLNTEVSKIYHKHLKASNYDNYDSLQIQQCIKNTKFADQMNKFSLLQTVIYSSTRLQFCGNQKAIKYVELVKTMHLNVAVIGCNISIKVHYLHNNLNCFPVHLDSCSKEAIFN